MGKEIELAIVFADVVGSTKLYELLGDLRARDMVGICIEVMRGATEQNHGTVIKTMGDEVMATFPTADDALNAAAQMQKQIVLHPSLKVEEQTVAIRIGCNFGPVVLREPGHFRLGRAYRESHDQPGEGGSDHHHARPWSISLSSEWRASVRQIDIATLKGRSSEVALYEVLWQTEDITSMVPAIAITSRERSNKTQRLRLRYQGQEILVQDGRANITMGRAEENDLVVKGNLISRLHARVEFNRNKFMLIDQSTNGTFVLGKDGEEAFVRRDSMQIRGEGLIGLGKAPDSNSSQVIRYICEE